MSIVASNIAQAIANLSPAEQARAQDRLKRDAVKTPVRRARVDRPDEVVVRAENPDTVRTLKDYSEEEAREDRKAGYTPNGATAEHTEEHSLDVNG